MVGAIDEQVAKVIASQVETTQMGVGIGAIEKGRRIARILLQDERILIYGILPLL